MLSCSPTSAGLNSTITCTGTYTTTAGDTSVTAAGTITLTTGSSITLYYNVSAADPSPNTPYFSSGSAPTTAAEGSSVPLALVTPSGVTPSLASNTSSVCTASGLTLNMVGVGTCNAVATGPASSPFYTEGTLNISISVTDTEPPVITTPGAQSAPTDAGANTATLDVTSLGSVTDNSGTTPAITYAIGGTPLAGAYAFPMGVTTVTMDASDGAGNAAAQQSFTVTVTDGEVPVITTPGAQSASTDTGANTATLDVTSLGSVTDNSGTTPAITYAIGGTPLAGAYAFPMGVTTVTMDASD
ncbi:HYR domain-containing protein, partial [Tritonibacter scottomollicae]|uniref:HYR domain-containing protein n=1 Tax=Tritonibacter scottomollicae TaxID=483013 RepID=UPI003BAC4DB1